MNMVVGGLLLSFLPPAIVKRGLQQQSLFMPLPTPAPPRCYRAMVTMVVGGFFLSFCFGRMANVVGKIDAEKSARAEQVG